LEGIPDEEEIFKDGNLCGMWYKEKEVVEPIPEWKIKKEDRGCNIF